MPKKSCMSGLFSFHDSSIMLFNVFKDSESGKGNNNKQTNEHHTRRVLIKDQVITVFDL